MQVLQTSVPSTIDLMSTVVDLMSTVKDTCLAGDPDAILQQQTATDAHSHSFVPCSAGINQAVLA